MAIRTRAAWDSIVRSLLADNAAGNISAGDLRGVLDDLGDSVIFADELVERINTALGGTTWQTGAGSQGSGVSLQTVLDAIRADGEVSGIELVKDTSQSDIITLRIQAVAVASHTRYAAIVDNTDADPADFPASAFTAAAATDSTSGVIAAPAYAGLSTFVTMAFATPVRLAGIQEEGNVLVPNIRSSFNPAVGAADVVVTIPGQGAHYVVAGIINSARAGANYVLTDE